MIQSFADLETELLFREEKSRRYASISRAALRKLIQLNQAGNLKDLAVPPGNRLEPLQGKRKGEHSIRINQQWRLVFVWGSRGPE
jgi:proteic killer suppression protein